MNQFFTNGAPGSSGGVVTLARSVAAAWLVLGGAGCTATGQRALFVHFGFGIEDSKCLLSMQVHLGRPFLVRASDFQELSGTVNYDHGKYLVDLLGSTAVEAGVYRGLMTLDRPFGSQGGGSSGGAGHLWFALSTNSDPGPIVGRVKGQYERDMGIPSSGDPTNGLDPAVSSPSNRQ
ncbi:MAG: hypothetical protein JNK85_26325 [Verrucomicrobiales bacterium]|nr:hypothetical protein [Verrucomicrobiales bacterium]